MISDNFYKVGEITNLPRKPQKQSNNNYSNFLIWKKGTRNTAELNQKHKTHAKFLYALTL